MIASVSYFLFLVFGAVLGARLLLLIAPWRELEIVCLALMGGCLCTVFWVVYGDKRWVRRWLMAGATAALIIIVCSYYALYFWRFPTVESYSKAQTGALTCSANLSPLVLVDQQGDQSISKAGSDDVLLSKYSFQSYDAFEIAADHVWDEKPFGDRSWNWQLHTMKPIVHLVQAYQVSGELKYIERAQFLVLDWIRDNALVFSEAPSEFSWNDHATALRAINWLYFVKVWRESPIWSSAKDRKILRILLAHGRMLAKSDFYTRNHNHGIDQDRALIALATTCPELNVSDQWAEVAEARVREQVQFAVSPSGVHLEHSPAYHMYGMHQIGSLGRFLEDAGAARSLAKYLKDTAEKMAGYVQEIVKPDGRLVTVGDTGHVSITDFETQLQAHDERPVLRDLAANGRTGRLSNSAVAYRAEGYSIVRDFDSGRLAFEDSTYLFFAAGAHQNRGHRQADDLSFSVMAGSRDLLIDPGVYSYKRDSAREFFTGASAHNTVVVDGRTYDGWDTSLDYFEDRGFAVSIVGSHRNYESLEFRRALFFVRPDLIVIVDDLWPVVVEEPTDSSVPSRSFEQLFHFARKTVVELDGLDGAAEVWASRNDERPLLRLWQFGKQVPTMRLYEGEKNPMQGWESPRWGEIEKAPVLGASLMGRSARFVTVIDLLSVGNDRIRRFHLGDEADDRVVLQWRESSDSYEMVVWPTTGGIKLLGPVSTLQ